MQKVFLSIAGKYKKQILDKGLDLKKVVHKAGEFIRNKIAVQQLSQTMIIMRNKNLLKK